MLDDQTIWLPPRGTAFTAVCDWCLADQTRHDGYRAATVSGTLRLEDDHGWTECGRGHRIRVRRADRSLAGVIR